MLGIKHQKIKFVDRATNRILTEESYGRIKK